MFTLKVAFAYNVRKWHLLSITDITNIRIRNVSNMHALVTILDVGHASFTSDISKMVRHYDVGLKGGHMGNQIWAFDLYCKL